MAQASGCFKEFKKVRCVQRIFACRFSACFIPKSLNLNETRLHFVWHAPDYVFFFRLCGYVFNLYVSRLCGVQTATRKTHTKKINDRKTAIYSQFRDRVLGYSQNSGSHAQGAASQSALVTLVIEGPKCGLICLILAASPSRSFDQAATVAFLTILIPNPEPLILLLPIQRVSEYI